MGTLRERGEATCVPSNCPFEVGKKIPGQTVSQFTIICGRQHLNDMIQILNAQNICHLMFTPPSQADLNIRPAPWYSYQRDSLPDLAYF